MGFNYAIEKAKFEREWTQLRVEYEKAGMSTEKINILHDYDWENFKKERIYAITPLVWQCVLLQGGENVAKKQNLTVNGCAFEKNIQMPV